MLVLTRKIGQQVLINNGIIQMKILGIDKDYDVISLGFNAPEHIDIDREEVYLRKLIQQSGFATQGV